MIKLHPGESLNEVQLAELAQVVVAGPDLERDGVVRWRCVDLQRLIEERFEVTYHERSVSNLLKAPGFSKLAPRPQHPAQDERVIETFKKTSRISFEAHIGHLPEGKPIEIWILR